MAIAAYCLAYSRLADRGWRSAPAVPRCRSITTSAVRAGVSVRSISTLSSVSALLDVLHPTRTDALMVWGRAPLLGAPARVFADETLCEAEAGLSRPPVELFSALGVRQICAHPGWGRARCR